MAVINLFEKEKEKIIQDALDGLLWKDNTPEQNSKLLLFLSEGNNLEKFKETSNRKIRIAVERVVDVFQKKGNFIVPIKYDWWVKREKKFEEERDQLESELMAAEEEFDLDKMIEISKEISTNLITQKEFYKCKEQRDKEIKW